MNPVELACVVLPLTALLYGMLGMRVRQERRWWGRFVTRRIAALVVDPYHAAAGRRPLGDDVQAAAARLLLDGLVTVTRRGNLALTAAGSDPGAGAGHPVPDALLAALRRRTAPASLGNVHARDAELRAAREEFHTACRNRLRSRLPAKPGRAGRPAAWAVWATLAVIVGTALALVGTDPHGPAEGAAATATWFAVPVQIGCLVRYGRLRDDARREALLSEGRSRNAPHPALAELAARDPETADRLRVSRGRTRRRRNRGRPRRSGASAGS
ncbi:hypothetical protein ABZZ17_34590 [Streptomyces sp. NPDC006512]|uniref:hypothetical protein n=1 Tax=Streptomyces sp. NPDC006512 TaxID=3154307 RepID=UPI0033A00FFE